MPEPALTVRYTLEELTVLADLYELDNLPGCRRASLSTSTRNLATRTLIARHVLAMPPAGGVELQQPHATVLGTLFAADDIVQYIRHRPAESFVDQWFATDAATVGLSELDGIVTMALYEGRVAPTPGRNLDDVAPDTTVSGFDEVITVHRSAGAPVSVERLLAVPHDG